MGLFNKIFSRNESKTSMNLTPLGEPINIGSSTIHLVEIAGGSFRPKSGIYAGNDIKIESFKIVFRPLSISILQGFTNNKVRFEKEAEDYGLISLSQIENAISNLNSASDMKFRLPTDLEWHYCELNRPELFGDKANYSSQTAFSDICVIADVDSDGGGMRQIEPTEFHTTNLVAVNMLRDFRNISSQTKFLCRLVVASSQKSVSKNNEKVFMPQCDFDLQRYNTFHFTEFSL